MTAKGVILFTATVGALLLCSCAKNEDTSSLTESQQEQSDFPRCIVGEWKCHETPLDNSELIRAISALLSVQTATISCMTQKQAIPA